MNKEIYRHGELLLKPVEILPVNIKEVRELKEEVLAHSETGHHHILTAEKDYKIYTTLDGKTFIELPTEAELWHKKTGKDIHRTHKIVPAIYEVIIKKEFDYFANTIKLVRD